MLKVYGAINLGFESSLIDVECHISNGLPGATIVGLANKSVDEAKDRLRAAFASTGLDFPRKKVLINLAPADLPKNDSGLDLAIAVSILGVNYNPKLSGSLFIGELGLDGGLKPASGIVGKLLEARKHGIKQAYIPIGSAKQAALVPGINIYILKTLKEAVDVLQGQSAKRIEPKAHIEPSKPLELLIDDVIGQEQAKRALCVAIAGKHNIHMYGPPGTGKTMLAKAASQLLPSLSIEESLEVTHLHSLVGATDGEAITEPPFRAPHHSASDVSIIGGGNNARPGEISLAHKGMLMLDELPEYSKKALESLRQPLEDKLVVVSRAKLTTTYPADFMLVATSNPCPCGFYGSSKACSCSAADIVRYQKKLSGPIMDRIDMHIQVDTVDPKHLLNKKSVKKTTILSKINGAIGVQLARNSGKLNSLLSAKELEKFGGLSPDAKEFIDTAARKMLLSSRGYLKTVRVSRTIADLEGSESIDTKHIAESLQYRKREPSF